MKYFTTLLSVVLTFAMCSPVLGADWWEQSSLKDILDSRTVTRNTSVGTLESAIRVNWVNDYIEVVAGGTVDNKEAVNMAHALSMAQKTARHLAYEKLAETISGINLTADATYDRELMTDSNLQTSVKALIRGAQVIEETHEQLADGSIIATVRLGIHITGPNSLMASSQPWLQNNKLPAPASYETPAESAAPVTGTPPYSGLIIDASGLNVRPAMAPRIISEGGEVIYGIAAVESNYLIQYGMVGYARSVDQAKTLERVGENPLVINAKNAGGKQLCDVVISKEDAAKLIQTGSASPFLKECRVVFVVN